MSELSGAHSEDVDSKVGCLVETFKGAREGDFDGSNVGILDGTFEGVWEGD